MSSPKHPQITKWTSPNKSYPAYCTCQAHRGYLTTKAIKVHNCLGKQCPYLSKFPEHGYWEQRERKKELKKQYKEALKNGNLTTPKTV